MPIAHPYSRTDLFRYFESRIEETEKPPLERHLAECQPCQKYVAFLRSFADGVSALTEEEFSSQEPCPNSWTLVSYEAGRLDEETARHVRAHLLFCDDCSEKYYALRRARPKTVDLILRGAGGIVECLRASWDAVWRLAPATAEARGADRVYLAPFRVEQTVIDPDTQAETTILLSIEGSLEEADHVRVDLDCKPNPKGWGVRLGDLDVRIDRNPTTVSTALSYGFYVLKVVKGDDSQIAKDADPLCTFSFTVEPFNLPEALASAQENLGRRDYGRALGILEDAIHRYPEADELQQFYTVVLIAATNDVDEHPPEPPSEGELDQVAEGSFRGVRDFLKDIWNSLRKQRSVDGDFSWVLAKAILDPSSVPLDELMQALRAERVPLPILSAIGVLGKRTVMLEDRAQRLESFFGDVKARQEQAAGLINDLRAAIANIQRDTTRSLDDKKAAADSLLDRFLEDLSKHGCALTDYEPFFCRSMGDDCWSWLGREVQLIFLSGEAVFWDIGKVPAIYSPDFTPALIQFSRGMELLVNNILQSGCRSIAETLARNAHLRQLIAGQRPDLDLSNALEPSRTLSLTQAATLLFVGGIIQKQRPGSFDRVAVRLMTATPSLTDPSLVIPFNFIGAFLRNGKVTLEPGSSSLFPDAEEVQLARKLIFGFDELRISGATFHRRVRSGYRGLNLFGVRKER